MLQEMQFMGLKISFVPDDFNNQFFLEVKGLHPVISSLPL